MAFSALPDGARVSLVFGTGTNNWTINIHATKTDWAEADAITLADAIRAGLNGLVTKPWSSGQSYREIVIYDLRSEFAPVYRPLVSAVVGSATGEITDRSSAVVITLRTAHRGRSGRGRLYVGGQAEGSMVSGSWDANHVVRVGTMITAIMNAFINNGWQPVVKSTYENKVFLNPAHAHAITSWESRSLIPGSQDRRNKRP